MLFEKGERMTIHNDFIPTVGDNEYVDICGHIMEKNANNLVEEWGFKITKEIADDLSGKNEKANKEYLKNHKERSRKYDIKGYICTYCQAESKNNPIRFEWQPWSPHGEGHLNSFLPIFFCENCGREFIGLVFTYGKKKEICDMESFKDFIKFKKQQD